MSARRLVIFLGLAASCSDPASTCLQDPLTRIEPIAAGVACELGGTLVHSGADADCDGTLDGLEVHHTTVVCTEQPGGTGALVRVDSVGAGDGCEAGGSVIRSGVDDDRDGVLGDEEVDSESFVCNGVSAESDLTTCDGSPVVFEGTVVALSESSLAPLEPVTCVDGNIIVNSGSLTSLDQLSALQKVTGDFLVVGSVSLDSLEGLRELVSVGGALMIQNNGLLQDLRGLESLRNFGALRIVGNANLTSLRGLEGLSVIGGDLEINGVPNLSHLAGLENLREARTLSIVNNDALTDLSALSSLERTTLHFQLVSNDALTSVELPSLSRVDGVLDLFEHERLETARFPGMVLLGAPMRIRGNAALREVFFASLATGGGIEMTGNQALEVISCPSLVYLSGELSGSQNAALTTLDLPSLSTVAGRVSFRFAPALTDLSGLAALETIGGVLALRDDDALVDLTGLESLVTVSGNMIIETNPSLVSVDQLESLERIAGGLEIKDNPQLPTSSAEALRDRVDVGDGAVISGNGPG